MKQDVVEFFKNNNKVKVVFTKKDGSERVMKCTTNFDFIPVFAFPEPLKEGQNPRKVNPDVMRVFDLDIEEWRSFRFDSVKTFEAMDD